MRRYLATLHRRPHNYKKRFALFVSGFITLFIFSLWSLVTFGQSGAVVAENQVESETGPFQSLRNNVASSIESFKSSFQELKEGFKPVDLEVEYKEMRQGALDVYGQ